MLIKILTIGKPKKKYFIQAINDYFERLKHYCKIEIIEIKETAKTSKSSDFQIKKMEAEKIQAKIQPRDYVVSLDRKGEMISSEGLAKFLQNGMNQNQNSFTFIIGGEVGLDKSILEKSAKILSLSKMTFTHDMSRMILLEQLYRAFTILAGQKYHK